MSGQRHLTYYRRGNFSLSSPPIFDLMPLQSLLAIQPAAKRLVAPRRVFALRGFVVLVIATILLQAFVSIGSRTATRTHFHVAGALVQKQDAGDGRIQADTDGDVQRHAHPHPHSHSHHASHEHNVERNDVVYVDTQNSDLPSSQASNRLALELDGFLFHWNPPSVDSSPHLIFAELTQRFRSRVEPPLERPPRISS